MFKESNYWNGTASSPPVSPNNASQNEASHSNSKNLPYRLYQQDKSKDRKMMGKRDSIKTKNPFIQRRSTLQTMLYQGMFMGSPSVSENLVNNNLTTSSFSNEESRNSRADIGDSEANEQTVSMRLDRIEDILLYLACRLRNQEIMENVKQEWRFLAEVMLSGLNELITFFRLVLSMF